MRPNYFCSCKNGNLQCYMLLKYLKSTYSTCGSKSSPVKPPPAPEARPSFLGSPTGFDSLNSLLVSECYISLDYSPRHCLFCHFMPVMLPSAPPLRRWSSRNDSIWIQNGMRRKVMHLNVIHIHRLLNLWHRK